ncbi:MAG: hypothetical protein Q4F15_03450 [Bacillota bacterium]|nr:hypothetical protein [Bacillota bacterium]
MFSLPKSTLLLLPLTLFVSACNLSANSSSSDELVDATGFMVLDITDISSDSYSEEESSFSYRNFTYYLKGVKSSVQGSASYLELEPNSGYVSYSGGYCDFAYLGIYCYSEAEVSTSFTIAIGSQNEAALIEAPEESGNVSYEVSLTSQNWKISAGDSPLLIYSVSMYN